MAGQETRDKPSTLNYADAPTRLGIICETFPDGVRITIPPLRFAGVAGVVLGVCLLPLAFLLGGDPTDLYRWVRSLFRPVVISVTSSLLSITNVKNNGEIQDLERPRDAVYEVKFVSHSGNLFIRAHGHDIIDCRPVNDPRVLAWMAETLRQAMRMAE